MAMALTSSKGIYREGYQPLPSGVFFSSFPNAVGDQRESEVAIENSLADLERLLKTQSMPSETAAMLIEPVLGEGGYLPVPPGFLKGLREICDRTGILPMRGPLERRIVFGLLRVLTRQPHPIVTTTAAKN